MKIFFKLTIVSLLVELKIISDAINDLIFQARAILQLTSASIMCRNKN